MHMYVYIYIYTRIYMYIHIPGNLVFPVDGHQMGMGTNIFSIFFCFLFYFILFLHIPGNLVFPVDGHQMGMGTNIFSIYFLSLFLFYFYFYFYIYQGIWCFQWTDTRWVWAPTFSQFMPTPRSQPRGRHTICKTRTWYV